MYEHTKTVRALNSFPQAPGRAPLSRAPLQELYDQSMESAATSNLDDLQRSWETLKNVVNGSRPALIGVHAVTVLSLLSGALLTACVLFTGAQISEKQKSLYEALERQQHYQESLQSISTKMESIEASLNEGLEPGKSPESQMAAHQVRESQ